jgi:nicotinamidase-related amidase
MGSATNRWMINVDDAVLLLIDHQSGLFQVVRDIEVPTLRKHVTALAKAAYIARIPTFTTASVPDGPNGPLIPDIAAANPDAVYIPRTGQINAWDNRAWVEAIEKTGRRTLLMAGTVTSVCMAFPALCAVEAGYKVFCIVDASGNWSRMATDIVIARVTQAGAMPTDTFAVLGEIQGTWNRPDADKFGAIMRDYLLPTYPELVECFTKAQQVQQTGPETVLDKAPKKALEPA